MSWTCRCLPAQVSVNTLTSALGAAEKWTRSRTPPPETPHLEQKSHDALYPHIRACSGPRCLCCNHWHVIGGQPWRWRGVRVMFECCVLESQRRAAVWSISTLSTVCWSLFYFEGRVGNSFILVDLKLPSCWQNKNYANVWKLSLCFRKTSRALYLQLLFSDSRVKIDVYAFWCG